MNTHQLSNMRLNLKRIAELFQFNRHLVYLIHLKKNKKQNNDIILK